MRAKPASGIAVRPVRAVPDVAEIRDEDEPRTGSEPEEEQPRTDDEVEQRSHERVHNHSVYGGASSAATTNQDGTTGVTAPMPRSRRAPSEME